MGRIKACRKYENPFEFDETHKLWMDANHRPIVRGTDHAIWNRLFFLPFEVTIPPEKIDRTLPQKLQAEAKGILAWAVRGAIRWYSEGLGRPDQIEQARQAYREEMDPLKEFFEECCVVERDATCSPRELFNAYKTWAADSGDQHMLTQRTFKQRLETSGYCKQPLSPRHWVGLALKRDKR